jgi:hypothetical protein
MVLSVVESMAILTKSRTLKYRHRELEEIDDNLLPLAASKLDFDATNGSVTKEQFDS